MKKMKSYIWIAAQIVIVALLVANLFNIQETIILDAASFEGNGEFRGDEWYFDASHGASEESLVSKELSVPTGVYGVRLFYETDTDMQNRCVASDLFATHAGVLTNGEHLYEGLNATDYEVWVWDGNGSLRIQVEYSARGTLTVQGAEIYDTGGMQRMLLFGVLLLLAVVDGVWMYRIANKDKVWTVEKKVTFMALVGIVLYASMPLWTDYIISGGDLVFHMLRIEGIKDGLLGGQFPVRIAPEWLQGHGYATSVFYGDTLLYIPAILRLIGFPIQTSYKALLFLLNLGTCITSYYAFSRILKERYLGVLCSALYTMSIFRFHKIYHSAALGEAISTMFIPLVLVGLYKIFTDDIKDKKYGWNWVIPTIGYCGMIQAHVLSTYIVGAFTILVCVILWKRVFRKETFLVLSLVVISSCLISAWYLVPFLDYMSSGAFRVNHISSQKIQFRGLQIAQLFKIYFKDGTNPFYYSDGMVDADPVGLGGALLGGLFLFIVLWQTGIIKNLDKKMVNAGKVAAVVAVCAMAMSTQVFPWDKIQRMGKLAATLTSCLILPSRFLNVATAALILVTGIAGLCIWKTGKAIWKGGFVVTIAMFFLVGNIGLLNDICDTRAFFRLYNVGGMGTGYISGEEYLPVETMASLLTYKAPIPNETVVLEGYEKDYLSIEAGCVNLSDAEGYIDMPLLYYEGYQAETDLGEALEVCPGENGVVRVVIPGGYQGIFTVEFVSPWYWRMAEVISVLSALSLMGFGVYKKNRRGTSYA